MLKQKPTPPQQSHNIQFSLAENGRYLLPIRAFGEVSRLACIEIKTIDRHLPQERSGCFIAINESLGLPR
jgi:hypothetical protein